jgi:outer membrane protein assembly factor BamB
MNRCLPLCRWLPPLAVLSALLLGTACSGPAPADAAKEAAGAEAWPMFGGGPSRNWANPFAKGILTDWSVKEGEEKNVKWSAQLGGTSYGGPVVAGGKVFVGTNNDKPRDKKIEGDRGVVMCFRAADGAFLWQATHEKLPNQAENDAAMQGIASTPAVDGDRVYYVSNRCELVCASTEPKPGTHEANFLWRLDMMKDLGVFPCQLAACSPLVAGDLVYVVTGNGVDQEKKQVVAPKAPSFLAVDKKTGKVVWQDNSPGDKIIEGQWTNPAYAEVNGQGQVIFPGGDGWLYSFEAKTGKPLWKFDCNPKVSEGMSGGRPIPRSYFIATPVVWENKVYLAIGRYFDDGSPSGPGHLWCIDITKSGDVSPVNDNFDPKAPENKNSALVWHFGGRTGNKTGRKNVFGRTLSTVAIADGLLYAADMDGFLYCLDPKTGQKYWDHDLKGNVWASPTVIEGKVYLGVENGDLSVFEHGKQKKEPVVIDTGGSIKGAPVAVNGVLYLQTESKLYAIAKK